jgi:hypothetical protein
MMKRNNLQHVRNNDEEFSSSSALIPFAFHLFPQLELYNQTCNSKETQINKFIIPNDVSWGESTLSSSSPEQVMENRKLKE